MKSTTQKRLRMFAGPNGSGKSTIFNEIKSKFNLGIYLNPDDIEKSIIDNSVIDLTNYGLHKINSTNFNHFLKNHSLYKKALSDGYKIGLVINNGIVHNPNTYTHSYEASILVDFIRTRLIDIGEKLTFETVMSHNSKIEILRRSKELGYKNYLYFISTDSVSINKARVIERVKNGGHFVPPEKIKIRYFRSSELLKSAIKQTYRSFLFDNSENKSKLILDVLNGNKVTFRSKIIPNWVDDYFLKKGDI